VSVSAIGGFAARFLLVLLVGALVWPWVAPRWQRAVAAAAGPLLAPTTVIVPTRDGGQSYIHRRGPGDEVETLALARDGLALQTLGLVLLPALVLATPLALRTRLALLVPGVALLFALQVATTVAWAPVARCLNGDPSDPLCSWAYWSLTTGGQLQGVALWGLLTWPAWLGKARATKR
jgi:hypothetical protein